MVIAAMWMERRKREIRLKIRQEVCAEWEAWLRRREDAEAKGIPFDEPRPKLKD